MDGYRMFGGNRAVIQTAGEQKFLEENPSTLLDRSEYSQMPMIGGATKHDGILPFLCQYQRLVGMIDYI